VWTSVVGDSTGSYLGLEYTLNEEITSGETYLFKARALNKWGWGDYTSEPYLEILAATIPSRVGIPVTTIDPLTGGFQITWTAPSENGAIITSYSIEI
jgi:hypothetical protein